MERIVQRRLLVTEIGKTTGCVARRYEVEVTSSTELFSLLHNPLLIKVEMLWDRVLGEKRMIFKQPKSN